jgi:hypothetical protein
MQKWLKYILSKLGRFLIRNNTCSMVWGHGLSKHAKVEEAISVAEASSIVNKRTSQTYLSSVFFFSRCSPAPPGFHCYFFLFLHEFERNTFILRLEVGSGLLSYSQFPLGHLSCWLWEGLRATGPIACFSSFPSTFSALTSKTSELALTWNHSHHFVVVVSSGRSVNW